MTKRKVFSLIGLVLSIYLIINMLVVPFVSDEPLWELGLIGYDHIAGIIILIELVLGIIALIMQLFGLIKKADFVHFGNGFYFSYHLYIFIEYLSNDVLEKAQIGLWLGLIVSALLFLVIFIGGFLKNEKTEKPVLASRKEPIGYDPKTGKPIYEEEKPEKKIVGYDPKTGKPIYEEEKAEKKIVGYDPKTGEPIYEKEKSEKKIVGYNPETGEPIYEKDAKERKPKKYNPETGEPIYED